MNEKERQDLADWLRTVLTRHLREVGHVVYTINGEPINYAILIGIMQLDLEREIKRIHAGGSRLSSKLAEREAIAVAVVAAIRREFLGDV